MSEFRMDSGRTRKSILQLKISFRGFTVRHNERWKFQSVYFLTVGSSYYGHSENSHFRIRTYYYEDSYFLNNEIPNIRENSITFND